MAELLDDWLADLGGGLATVRDTLAAAASLLVLQAPLLATIIALAYVLGVLPAAG